MKIVIDIPDSAYNAFKEWDEQGVATIEESIIANGTSLPKGHGRLIDADAYRKEMMNSREFNFFKILDMQPTIIEANKEGE